MFRTSGSSSKTLIRVTHSHEFFRQGDSFHPPYLRVLYVLTPALMVLLTPEVRLMSGACAPDLSANALAAAKHSSLRGRRRLDRRHRNLRYGNTRERLRSRSLVYQTGFRRSRYLGFNFQGRGSCISDRCLSGEVYASTGYNGYFALLYLFSAGLCFLLGLGFEFIVIGPPLIASILGLTVYLTIRGPVIIYASRKDTRGLAPVLMGTRAHSQIGY